MIFSFQRRGAEPVQVAGDDTMAGYYDPDRPTDPMGTTRNSNQGR